MSTGMSQESQMLLRLLEDMQWHPRPEIQEKLKAAVAPGKALRRYQLNERSRIEQSGPRKGPELTEDEKIDSGRRSIANDTINSLKKRHVEVVDTEQGRMLRRRPVPLPIADSYRSASPPVAAAVVAGPPPDLAGGLNSAAGLTPSYTAPEVVAFFSEAQIRLIVAEVVEDVVGHVVGAQLDRFQRGMRGFLLGRFADLEQFIRPGDRRRPAVPTRRNR